MKRFTILLVIASIAFAFNGFGQEVLLNGTFESWDDVTTPTSWTHVENVDQESTVEHVHGGTYSAKHTGGTSDLGQTIPGIIPGDDYDLTLWYKVTAGDPTSARIWSYWRDASGTLPDNGAELRGPNNSYFDNNGGVWTSYSVTVTAPAAAVYFYFEVRTYSGATVYWDDFSFFHVVSGTPTIIVSESSLTGFSYEVGNGPSAAQTFTVEGIDLTDDITVSPSTNYEISLDNTTYQLTPITLTQTGGVVTTTTIYTRLQAGLAAGDYIEDIVISSTSATDRTVTCTGAVEAPVMATLPYFEPFDADLGDCYTYSVSGGTKEWVWGFDGTAYMNGYNSGETEEDWLILPGIDMDSYTDVIMTFDNWYKYGDFDDNDHYLKLYYSTNYPGTGDPSTIDADWTELPFHKPSGWETWTNSLVVDLSGVSGSSVYIAFKYYYLSDSYRTWQIDNINIYEGARVNVEFQVNMEDNLPVSGDGVHIAGSFADWWNPAGIELLDGNMDNIYTTTLSLFDGEEYHFKYINGNIWAGEESVPPACQAPGTTNRYEVISGPDYSIPTVCFSSCSDCGLVFSYDVTFQVDMQNETVGGVVNIAGDFNTWGDTPMTNICGHIWAITLTFDEGAYFEYKFKNGGDWESLGNRTFTVPSENTVLDLVCYSSYEHCPAVDFVMINEVDSDTPGFDSEEFIELYDGGIGCTPLNGLVVVLYNGGDDASYSPAIDLDGYLTDANGYFVIGSTGMGTDIEISPGGSGWLQNGPDAVALHVGNDADYPNDTPVSDVSLIDALVYDTNDGDDAGLLDVLTPGEPQINEDGRGDKDFESNQRIPNGSGGLRITSTYDQSPTTMGIENTGIYTDWTGSADNNWDNPGNWHNGVPTDMLNAEIPDVSLLDAPFPTITGSATCLSLYMAPGSALDIATTGSLTVTGTFTNNGGALTIKSDATGTGSLIESNGVMATMEQHISADAWHMVSSPVAGAQSAVYAGIYLYEWDEPNGDFIEITALNYGLDNKGFYAWSESPIPSPTDVVFTGNLNTGDKNPTLTYNPASYTLPDLPGWNLEGNPYPSGLTWDNTWSQTSLDPTVYIWDASGSGQWLIYNYTPGAVGNTLPNGEIPPAQGFFVKANAALPAMTIPNNKRVHTSNGFYKSTNENGDVIEINITSSVNSYSDRMFVGVNSNATNNFDSEYDAYKLKGIEAAPQLYTYTADGNEVSVNSIPEANNQTTIPVGIEVGEAGSYVLSLNEIVGFDGTPVYLEDLQNNTIVNMKSIGNYKFAATPDDDPNRFLLHFGHGETPPFVAGNTSMDMIAYSFENTIVLNTEKPITGEVKVYDILGREIMSEKVTELSYREFQMNELSGYFIVYVISGEDTFAEKVYLK